MQDLSPVNQLREIGKAFVDRLYFGIGRNSPNYPRKPIDGTSSGVLNQMNEFIYGGKHHSRHDA